MTGLHREINAPLLALYGTGTILGAGIFVLIGKIAGLAGYWMPLAFLLAGFVAAINGLVYAELATRHPGAGGPSDYVQQAFHRRWFSWMIGWMIVATGLVSAATIANGFAGYLSQFVNATDWVTKLLLLLVLGGIAAAGAKESAWFMAITTTLGILGLLWVLYLGFFHAAGDAHPWQLFHNSDLPSLWDSTTGIGVLSATFLAVYAFIGFEDIVHLAEETKNPERSLPIAITAALIISAVFYVTVSIAALMAVDPQTLANSKAPLIEVNNAAGYPVWPLASLSLWIILNGALAQIIMATRVLYRLSRSNGAPSWFANVNKTSNTPVFATLFSTTSVIILAIAYPLQTLASVTSLIFLLIFIVSNIALITLERREASAPFDVPVYLPWFGLVISLGLLLGNFFLTPSG